MTRGRMVAVCTSKGFAKAVCCCAVAAAFPSLAGCSEEVLPLLPMAEIHGSIDLEDRRPTGDLIGWNIGRGTLYGPEGDPTHPEWRTPEREQAFALLAQIRPAYGRAPLVRWSGLQIDGVLGADGYHFWDFVRPDREVADTDNMGSFQYMAIIEEIAGDPLIMLNFGSGTAAEAGRYVDHLVGTGPSPEVTARADWGHPEPYSVHAWEIGNEVYGFWNTAFDAAGAYSYANPDAMHGGDADWHGRPAMNVSDYAARALAYADAVSAVHPQARFWIPLGQASMETWGGLESALGALEPLLVDDRVQAVVIHHYQVDDAATLGFFDKAAPEMAIAGSELFRPLYQELRERISALPRAEPLAIVVTEYHVAGAFTLGDFDGRADTALPGLGVADILITFAQLGIEAAAQHMAIAFGGSADTEVLFEPWYNPVRNVDGVVQPRPSYVATRLVADHLLEDTVALEIPDLPTARYKQGSRSLVHAVAFAGDGEAAIILLNRDLAAARELTIDLPESTELEVESARAYAPASWEDAVGDALPELTEITVEQTRHRLRVELPRHSVVGIKLVEG